MAWWMNASLRDTRLHFRCEFQVSGRDESVNAWRALQNHFRWWVKYRARGDKSGLEGEWFGKGGIWKHSLPDQMAVETVAEKDGQGTSLWSMRMDEACRAVEKRRWISDVALTAEPGKPVTVFLQVQYEVEPRFAHREPEAPPPNSPNVVKRILSDDRLWVFAGTESLGLEPEYWKPGNGYLLWERILDENRDCPLVYISRLYAEDRLAIDAEGLAKTLAGVASVHVASSVKLDKETGKHFSPELRCWNGRMRVYLPRVLAGDARDARRHRCYEAHELEGEQGPAILRELQATLARYVLQQGRAKVRVVEDVRRIGSERAIQRLKANLERALTEEEKAKELQAYVWALQQEQSILKKKIDDLEKEVRRVEDERDFQRLELEEQVLEWMSRYEKVTDQFAGFQKSLKEKQNLLTSLQDRASVMERLSELPVKVTAVCEFFGKGFGDRLDFSERGRRSFAKAQFADAKSVWNALWKLYYVLHPQVFDGDASVDLEGLFRREGLDLAMSEGKLTKKNSHLMRQREDTYQNRKISIAPHLKFSSKGEYLRIYFAIDRESRRFVIGEVTDHLDTAGTQRRKN
jgi:hypothetical protein